MLDAKGHIDQVASFNLNGKHRAIVGVNVKQTRTLQDKAHFILGVGVFTFEFLHHGIEIRRFWSHLHDISGDIASLGFQPVDLRLVSLKNGISGSIGADALFKLPTLMPDSERFQKCADGF